MRLLLPLALLALGLGCAKDTKQDIDDVVDNDDDLDPAVRLFASFEDEDTTLLVGALLTFETLAEDYDLTATVDQRSFITNPLTAENLGGADAVPGTSPDDQIPRVVLGRSLRTYDENVTLAWELNQVCIESNTTMYYARTLTSDLACFQDASCDALRSTNEVRKENPLAKAWYDLYKDFRRVDLGDGREALISRSWADKVYQGDNGRTDFAQSYVAEAWIPQEGQLLRVYASWFEINIGLGDDAMAGLIIDGIAEGMENADAFLAIEDRDAEDAFDYCGADPEREYDRPAAE